MRTKTSIEIFTYWQRIRAADAAPLRRDIQPGEMRHILPELFILEKMPSGDPLFRLAGTRICSLFGRELRGAAFSTLWSAGQDGAATTIAAGVMDHARPALLNVTGFNTAGRSLRLEMVLLPVRSCDSACDRLLGSLAPEAAANGLGTDSCEYLTLDRSRLIGRDEGGAVTMTEAGTVAGKPPLSARGIELEAIARRFGHLRPFGSDRRT